jgi:hypothetical protein
MPLPPPPSRPVAPWRAALLPRLRRTLVLWLLLLAGLLLFRRFFGGELSGAAAGDGAGQAGRWIWFPLLVAAGLGLFAVLTIWRARLARANQRGLALMTGGDAAGAAEIFARLGRSRTAGAALRSVGAYNLALARLRLGQHGPALEALAPFEEGGARMLRAPAAGASALCCALRGELEAGERWVAEAHRRFAAGGAIPTRFHLAAAAILALRRGEPAAARDLFERDWAELERGVTADFVRGLRVACALAAERAGGEAPGALAELLAGARPSRPGELAWLSASWPEMAAYLAAHGLS